ncbi:MAG: DUF6291 domain-containing protein, partial [Clostridiales bacterium]|nr:DUF6291 domain-containing protein [Clostridiales bacterium]
MARTYAALSHEYRKEMRQLSDAEFGRLCRALIDYSVSGKPIALSGNERFYAERVMTQEDRVQQSYEELISRNRENGKKGGRPRKNPTEPTVTQKTEPKTEPKPKPELNSPPAIAGGREGDKSP